ncbi:MAG TPA: hypothetical protein VFE33_27705 [Thermoanaerobaculia bacterium]|nr:hypothetical protein [Thermoanaerobaculia bacterium]
MEIHPPSARREAANVLRLAAVILLATWVYLAHTATPRTASAAGRADLVSYQKLFRDLSPHEQRMFRALHEGLLEAENLRSASGAWPTPATLAEQGIPPFAADPTDRETYTWTFHHEGILLNYLGLPAAPAASGRPAYLLFVQEPTPGAPPDRAPNDEEHHRLANGDVLHVSVWLHAPGAKLGDTLYGLPESDGWIQLLAGASASAASSPSPQ